ncbi:MAG: FAD-binding protein [Treponema sp.]
MIKEVSVTVTAEQESDKALIKQMVCRTLAKSGQRVNENDVTLVFIKRSIDARHNQVKIFLRYKVYIGEKPGDTQTDELPVWKKADGSKSVIIIGSGPAGIFAALRLLEQGIKPIIIERGEEVSSRKRAIAEISTKGVVGENSNYCFGEGGAGTFSDGKLYTRSNKRGNINRILQIFANFGADKIILTDSHPHIGTDKLPAIISAIQEKIISLGGEFHFNTKCTDFITKDVNGKLAATGVQTEDTLTKEKKSFSADSILLATGHSAVDIYELLAKTAPSSLESKTFAVGVRVEHPRELIDSIQYHGNVGNLPAAEYRLTSQQDDRGVYSFCMCPGGFVVPSATSPEQIVINGMSSASRNSKWSNSAIVVETRPEDIPAEYVEKAKEKNCTALAGLLWRTDLEHQTYLHGENQKAPAQRLVDFMANKKSETLPESSYTPGVVSSNLNEWLPKQIAYRLKPAFKEFDKNMKGFISNDALLIASETRTSTPVRILRDKDTCECTAVKNLYPAGEGSGYAGGIVSSAMDGENCAKEIISSLVK